MNTLMYASASGELLSVPITPEQICCYGEDEKFRFVSIAKEIYVVYRSEHLAPRLTEEGAKVAWPIPTVGLSLIDERGIDIAIPGDAFFLYQNDDGIGAVDIDPKRFREAFKIRRSIVELLGGLRYFQHEGRDYEIPRANVYPWQDRYFLELFGEATFWKHLEEDWYAFG